MKNGKILGSSVLIALSSSLCCITPLVAGLSGISGLASNFSWIAPLRPYLIGVNVIILGVAWYLALRKVEPDGCGCEPAKKGFMQSKVFLSIVTLVSLLFIAFPSYSNFFQPDTSSSIQLLPQSKNKQIIIGISGMTCQSCELHVEGEVRKLTGISLVKASYEKKNATIEYDTSKVDIAKIRTAINSTGYKAEELNK